MNNPRAIQRFQREARVGAQLQHENLVRIYDEGEANGKCYLVMEYIEGKNIGTMIAENGPIPGDVAARLARQVALGLEHAQQKGLIHRDVNPYNILVTRDGIAKLTDLGLAIDLTDQARSPARGRRSARSTTSLPNRPGTRTRSTPEATSIRSGAHSITCSPARCRSPARACPRSSSATRRSSPSRSTSWCRPSPRALPRWSRR